MINYTDHPVALALLLTELEEAKEHLEKLIQDMGNRGRMDDAEFAVYLGHVYAHLNRVWHARDLATEIPDDQRDMYSRFPSDLTPVG